MPKIAYIRIKPFGKIYHYENKIESLKIGDLTVVEGDFGLTIGEVVAIAEKEEQNLKPVIRIATQEDLKNFENNTLMEKEAYKFCLERIK